MGLTAHFYELLHPHLKETKPMQTKTKLNWGDVNQRASWIADQIDDDALIYGIPRGGIYAAQAVLRHLGRSANIVDDPSIAHVIIDDIVDSGKTRGEYQGKYGVSVLALVDKTSDEDAELGWVEFPWEVASTELGVEDNIRRILQFIGEDVTREGLKDTPKRVAKSYAELFKGYGQDPKDIITVFGDDVGSMDEMILLKNIEFTSHCEHHMLPFRGRAHIAYLPDSKVIGVSKLARILDIYCARLQIQERIGSQVTDALQKYLQPTGAACILEAHHQCMSCRGVRKNESIMVTSSLTGAFRNNDAARAELFSLIRS